MNAGDRNKGNANRLKEFYFVQGFKLYEKLKVPGAESAEEMFNEDEDGKSEDGKIAELPELPGIKLKESVASKRGKQDDASKDKEEEDDLDEDITDDVYVNDGGDEAEDDDEEEEDEKGEKKVSSKKKKPDISDFPMNNREPDTSFVPAAEMHKDFQNTQIRNREYDFSRTNNHNRGRLQIKSAEPSKPQQRHPDIGNQSPKPVIKRLTPATLPPMVNFLPRRLNSSTVISKTTSRPIVPPHFVSLAKSSNHPETAAAASPEKLFLLPYGSRTSSATGRFFTPVSNEQLIPNGQRGMYRDNSRAGGRYGEEMNDFKRIGIPLTGPEVVAEKEKQEPEKSDDFYENTLRNLRSRKLSRIRRDTRTQESDINLQLQQLDEIESIYEDHPALMTNPPKTVDELLRRLVLQQILEESPTFTMNGKIYSSVPEAPATRNPSSRTMLAIDSIKQVPNLLPVLKHPIADNSKRIEEIVVNYLAPEPATPNYMVRSNEVYSMEPSSVVRNSAGAPQEIQMNQQSIALEEPIEPITMTQYNQLMYNLNNLGSIFSETSSLTGPMISDIRPKYLESMPTIQVPSGQFYANDLRQLHEDNKPRPYKHYFSNILRRIPHQLSTILSPNRLNSGASHGHGQIPRNSRRKAWFRRRSEAKNRQNHEEFYTPEASELSLAQTPFILPLNQVERTTQMSPIRKFLQSFSGKKN